MHEQHQHGDRAADRSGEPAADREDVDEGEAAEQRVPEAEPNSSCGSRPRRIGAATIQNFSGGFSRKAAVFVGAALGLEPVAGFEDAIDGEGVDGFVVLEIGAAETDEERQAEEREHESQPEPAQPSFLDASDERPDPRDVHLLDRDRLQLGLGEKRRQVEIGLEADVDGERRDRPLDRRQQRGSGCGSD